MISIKCSALETVRKNPAAYGQLLANANYKEQRGTHGMFACFQEVAKQVHDHQLNLAEGVKALWVKFAAFNKTSANLSHQDLLADQFVKYMEQFSKQSFEMVDGWHNMKWQIAEDANLTGRTPWVAADRQHYYAYFITEKDYDWQSELRFQLYQQYLAENTLQCELHEVYVGVFSLASNAFDFKNFSRSELTTATDEARILVGKVQSAYQREKTAVKQ